MQTPIQEGYEAGIMNRMPSHPYLRQSIMERQFMLGFKRGRERRVWLNARGQKRVEHVVVKNGKNDWHWELLVEKQIYTQGWGKSQKEAYQMCENANMDRVMQRIAS